MKKRLLFFIGCVCFLFLGCTPTQKQQALCYSGCILATMPKCVRQCQEQQPASGTFNREPLATFEKAKILQKREESKNGKSKKGKK